MLQAWLSIGYIVLLAILVLAFILWRRGAPVLSIAALVVGIPLWFGWEYARPTWTTGLITGTEVRRSDPDAAGVSKKVEQRLAGDFLHHASTPGTQVEEQPRILPGVARLKAVIDAHFLDQAQIVRGSDLIVWQRV